MDKRMSWSFAGIITLAQTALLIGILLTVIFVAPSVPALCCYNLFLYLIIGVFSVLAWRKLFSKMGDIQTTKQPDELPIVEVDSDADKESGQE